MSLPVGIASAIFVVFLIIRILIATRNRCRTIHKKPDMAVVLTRSASNVLALASVLSMIALSVTGNDFKPAFVAMIIIMVIGGVLAFVLDLRINRNTP